MKKETKKKNVISFSGNESGKLKTISFKGVVEDAKKK